MARVSFAPLLIVLAALSCGCSHESTTCATNIVSATVVATYCSHRAGNDEMLDLLILWRGRPGWFQRRGTGESGTRGSHTAGARTNGQVSDYRTYDGVTIGFDADFDADVVRIGTAQISLARVNAVLVDAVDSPGGANVGSTQQITARVKPGDDPNVAVIAPSPSLVRYLQCEIPMPHTQIRQPPVITVCEKLAARGK